MAALARVDELAILVSVKHCSAYGPLFPISRIDPCLNREADRRGGLGRARGDVRSVPSMRRVMTLHHSRRKGKAGVGEDQCSTRFGAIRIRPAEIVADKRKKT